MSIANGKEQLNNVDNAYHTQVNKMHFKEEIYS